MTAHGGGRRGSRGVERDCLASQRRKMLRSRGALIAGQRVLLSSQAALVDLFLSAVRPRRVSGGCSGLIGTVSTCGRASLSVSLVSTEHWNGRTGRAVYGLHTCCSRARACWRSCAHPPPVEDMTQSGRCAGVPTMRVGDRPRCRMRVLARIRKSTRIARLYVSW